MDKIKNNIEYPKKILIKQGNDEVVETNTDFENAKKLPVRKLKYIGLRSFLKLAIPPVIGLGLLVVVWNFISYQFKGVPDPVATWNSAVVLFSDPLYENGPSDVGIGWNIINSLERVILGVGLAMFVGIPIGFMVGRFEFINRMTFQIFNLFRPVSPIAWLPLGLLLFKAANPVVIWVIFISALWHMIINTAVGVNKVPQDYMDVAKQLNLTEWEVISNVLFPYTLPHVLTGIRLSIGAAWLVTVAAEMLTGGIGIGNWIWSEWGKSNIEHIIIAIFVVGILGYLFDLVLMQMIKHFSYD